MENAVREDREFAWVEGLLYDLYSDLNRRDSAEEAIKAAMKLQYKLPERYQFYVRDGYYIMQGDWQGAFENASHWVELYPNATQGRYSLAGHYQRMNQPDMAIAQYARILEMEPESHDNLRAIGNLLSQKGEYDEALEYYERYASLYPNKSESLLEEELGKLEAFTQTCNWEALSWIVWAGRGKLAEYREEYSQAIDREIKVWLTNEIGQCYRKLKKFEPFSPLAHYELALVYRAQEKKEQAREHLETALYVWEEADAEYKPAKEAREKLAEWESDTESN